MKKIIKMAFAVVAFAAVGLGSYKAYGSYTAANMSEEDLLIAENVLALSEDIKVTYVKVVKDSGSCYTTKVSGQEEKYENGIRYIRYSYVPELSDDIWQDCKTVPCFGGGCTDECVEIKCKNGYKSKDECPTNSEWIMVLNKTF